MKKWEGRKPRIRGSVKKWDNSGIFTDVTLLNFSLPLTSRYLLTVHEYLVSDCLRRYVSGSIVVILVVCGWRGGGDYSAHWRPQRQGQAIEW